MTFNKTVAYLLLIFAIISSYAIASSASNDNQDLNLIITAPASSHGVASDKNAPTEFKDIKKSFEYSKILMSELLEITNGMPSFNAVYDFLKETKDCNIIIDDNRDIEENSLTVNDGEIRVALRMLAPGDEEILKKSIKNHPVYNLPEDITLEEYNQIWIVHYFYKAAFACIGHKMRDEIDESLKTENRVGIECYTIKLENAMRIMTLMKNSDSDYESFIRKYYIDTPEYYIQCYPEFEYGYKEHE